MKLFLAVSLVSFFAVTIFPLTDIRAAEFAVSTNSVVVLVGGKDARRALTTEDDFIRALSEFDKAARAKSEMPVSRARFLNFIEGEVAMWTDADVAKVERAATDARKKLSQFKLALPARILLVKTTGREEADSAYCRGTNVIVLSRQFVNGSAAELNSILIHELFHLLSRNNPQLREKLYALIGFKPCAEITVPPTLEARRITNPDAPRLDYFIEVTRGEQKLDVVPVLFATPGRWNKEKGGEFFAYFTWKLMVIESGKSSPELNVNGEPVLLSSKQVSGFREQIGEQPGPILQAEEILAEYFVKFAEGHGKIPVPVQEGMRKLLMQ